MEHIKVELRIRPFTEKELSTGKKAAWNTDFQTDEIRAVQSHLHNTPFTFDKIYPSTCDNQTLYRNSCKEIVQKALEGIDTTIFVYGQTGSGKTHTMLGPPTEDFNFNGMIYSGLNDIYKRIEAKDEFEEFFISCSYIEIYNEQIFDLLSKPEELKNPLTIFEDTDNAKFLVKGKTQVRIETIDEVFKILKYGETNRRYAETYFNHKSSRSHTIFSVAIRVTKIADNSESFVKESTINFVDLAGNERLLYEYKLRDKTPQKMRSSSFSSKKDLKFNTNDFYAPGEKNNRLKESKHINKSLFFLTQVIYLTSRGKKGNHIPFRNSPLTKILRSSLGGYSRTLLILCISPTDFDFDISLSTLRFGKCAKKIENKVKPNIISSYNKEAIQAVVDSYEKRINAFNDKIKELENHQVDFLSFWQNLGQLKKNMIEKLLNYNKNLTNQNKLGFEEEIYTDVLLGDAGIIFNVKKESGANFNMKFENINCLNCKFKRTIDDFNIKSIPVVFKIFKEKLGKESGLEEFFINSLNSIENNQKKQEEEYDGLFTTIETKFQDFVPFVKNLIDKIGHLREELSHYKEPLNLENLSDWEVDQYYKNIKNIYKIYQEERLTRKIIKKLNKNKDLLESTNKPPPINDDDFVVEELEDFETFKKNIQENLKQSIQIFKVQKKEKEEQDGNFFENVKKQISQFIDEIYDTNYKIQKKLFQFHKNVKKRFHFFEKKFEWLYNKIHNDNKKNNQAHPEKSGMKRNQSEGNISNNSLSALNKSIEIDKDKNEDEFFVYNMLNKKMQKLHEYKQGINELKNMHKSALNRQDISEIIQKNPNFEDNEEENEFDQNFKNKSIVENNRSRVKSDLPIHKKYNTLNKINDEEDIDKELIKSNLKFDISNFIDGDLDMQIDLNKFKINNEDDNEIFDQNLTPINPLDLRQSYMTEERDTIYDLNDKILKESLVLPNDDKGYEKFMISDKRNKKYESIRSDRFNKDINKESIEDFKKKNLQSLPKKKPIVNLSTKFKKIGEQEKTSYAKILKTKK